MFITFLMVSILLIALSLLCASVANFSFKEDGSIPQKDRLISRRLISHGIKNQLISPGVGDNLVYHTVTVHSPLL